MERIVNFFSKLAHFLAVYFHDHFDFGAKSADMWT